ncbi:type II toxin-antitoxin system RelE/ParE family toxin [uncultured Winogradskyella sp.]|uniref:type II toxin-antitoxin system RelE/ParE family toxin n=1 Tax=uncultured Winogradskyella sp. TaxID=395353 RepID=UPI0026144BE9|nr:type II toxin-antitoxin system RelE/ParE family toxin [uncultured Winogradskyella sp.]
MEENFSFSEDAKRELHRIACYFEYLEKGDQFFNDFIRQLNLLKQFPYSFQVRYKDVRIVALENYPYSLHYRVIKGHIYIVHVLNQSQDY